MLHGDIATVLINPGVKNGGDVGMSQGPGNLGFCEESTPLGGGELRIISAFGRGEFECHFSIDKRVSRQKHLRQLILAQAPYDLILADATAFDWGNCVDQLNSCHDEMPLGTAPVHSRPFGVSDKTCV
jgi:hypothetical protein